MEKMEELKEMLCEELDDITKKGQLTAGDLDTVDKLTHSIKSLETIMAMNGYSNDGSYESYDMMYDGRSNARNGRMNRGSYARNRDARGRYSRRGYSRDGMMEELEDLMNEASTEQEKEAIRRCIEQMR